MVVTRYIGGDKSDIIADIEYINGKYFTTYNPKTCPCSGGRYDSLEDAKAQVEWLRPSARKLNDLCINCVTECSGTVEAVWTGCVYRKTK